MDITEFDYDLPASLIANQPLPQRSASRLCYLNRQNQHIAHRHIRELPDLLTSNDLLVFNNSKVIPARLYGQKTTGGKVEVLVERILSSRNALALIKASKSPKIGSKLIFSEGIAIEITGRENDLFHLALVSSGTLLAFLEKHGHIPLPSYIKRPDTAEDRQRYQTIFADPLGSVAAPTAGLHFDKLLLDNLRKKGIQIAFVTLHVGAGTFQPVRTTDITRHQMHREYVDVTSKLCELIRQTKARGGRVIAVGTTTVRSLESATKNNQLSPFQSETRLFIYPGYQFQCVDGLITNFHLPRSSLLMLVSAFAGHSLIRRAYEAAIIEKYRFFSYGDAMLIL